MIATRLTQHLLMVTALSVVGSTAWAYEPLPENFHNENARDLNVISIEPTVIDERYYTSGKVESAHHLQLNTLPAGAPIPDVAPAEKIKLTDAEKKALNWQDPAPVQESKSANSQSK